MLDDRENPRTPTGTGACPERFATMDGEGDAASATALEEELEGAEIRGAVAVEL